MITVKDLIWVVVFFILIMILLVLMRPIFILKTDPINGLPLREISGGKLLGWTMILTIIVGLIFLLVKNMNKDNEIYI